MNANIKTAYENGQLVLFLGAGCSLTSKDQYGNNLLSGSDLSKQIAKTLGWKYDNEPLSTVYSAAKNVLGNGLSDLLVELYKHCIPSECQGQLKNVIIPPA